LQEPPAVTEHPFTLLQAVPELVAASKPAQEDSFGVDPVVTLVRASGSPFKSAPQYFSTSKVHACAASASVAPVLQDAAVAEYVSACAAT